MVILFTYYTGYIVRPIDCDRSLIAINAFHDIPENSVDVMSYGSSIMWRGLDTAELYKRYGIAAYNYGNNWQRINTTELFVRDSFRTQHPKIAIIEVSRVADILSDNELDGEIYYTKEIKHFNGKSKYLKQCFGNNIKRYAGYYIPLVGFHSNWENLQQKSFRKPEDWIDFHKTFGQVKLDVTKSIDISDYHTFSQKDLSEESIYVLDQIVEECRSNNTDVLFVTFPKQEEYSYSESMKKYAADNKCRYLDLYEYIDDIGLDGAVDFSDEIHLSAQGSTKVADFLGSFIKSNYDINDRRLEKNNFWERNTR